MTLEELKLNCLQMALEYKPNTPQHQIEIAEILMKAIIHDEFNKSALEDALKKIKGH